MATFILVHGAWHGGWCFDQVAALLRKEGHDVFAPDLPGMGGSEAELAAVTLQGWADFVAKLCRDAPSRPVVLAGHSRGGIVISQAAETAMPMRTPIPTATATPIPTPIPTAMATPTRTASTWTTG